MKLTPLEYHCRQWFSRCVNVNSYPPKQHYLYSIFPISSMIFSLFSDPLFHQYLFDQAYRFGLYIPYIVKDILTFIQTHYFIIVHLIKSIILVCKFSISSTIFSLLFKIFISSLFIWSKVSYLVIIDEISFHKSRCSELW